MPRYLVRLPWRDLAACFPGMTDREIGVQVGRTMRTVQRWKHHGVPLLEADQVACQAGLHPVEVWGFDYHRAWDEHDKIRAEARTAKQLLDRQRIEERGWGEVFRSWQQWHEQSYRWDMERAA